LKPGAISDEVVGLLLERQVSALEPCLRKDGVQAIMRGLLRDTLSVYQTTVLPFRRARVILKCMEFLWKNENSSCGETGWTAEHLGNEVSHLLAVEVTRLTFPPVECLNSFVAGPRARLPVCIIPRTIYCRNSSLAEPLRVSQRRVVDDFDRVIPYGGGMQDPPRAHS